MTLLIVVVYLVSALAAARLIYPLVIDKAREDHGYPGPFAMPLWAYTTYALVIAFAWPAVAVAWLFHRVIGHHLVRFIRGRVSS